ncbi:hypothetical protein [Halalkalicoccus jeotgali]|uniref:Uncharacterized protein n=1 Tax=Halalkalicoccus jeotgali (strain DSM 18796 / CECT 7217 / JCM 14584 / KCTC 4019 / B3) TaxID=795797 RepID=D8J2J3_HALJB|nr:hypothetical protein [Halalkalicoccus jeotgali]ADJ14950.1 hypothetical protein HacjB3_07825 [Halalkalicoccus jeotgali B3]ELY35034.1 hypothetical protein C497_14897 [Halalkalicoccus jeotgali B3]
MVALLAIIKKAATFGYKKYGIPGALVSVVLALWGYRFVKKALGGSKSSN